MWLMIILKATKKQDFTLFLENTFLQKSQREFKVIPPSRLFRVNLFSVLSSREVDGFYKVRYILPPSIGQRVAAQVLICCLPSFTQLFLLTHALSNPCAQTTVYIAFSPEGPWTITNII